MNKSIAEKKNRDAFSVDNQVGHLLRLAYQSVSAQLADRIRPYGLTPVQFVALMRLMEFGPLSQSQLGRLVSMPPANIHSLIGRLKKRNLIKTGPSPEDKRLLIIDLTVKGENLAGNLIPLDKESATAALAPLTLAERSSLRKILRKII